MTSFSRLSFERGHFVPYNGFWDIQSKKVHFHLGLVLQRGTEKWVQTRNVMAVHSINMCLPYYPTVLIILYTDSQELSRLYQDISPDTTLMQPARRKDI